ncbi:hypothetical protein [Hansschlegelia sp.]|uniref:hypothetical protein n=1 Tax=Hansschlegelia sp. TaxID=2041892 RepID=UPI002C29845F|nr:hypothetical protein [Hansschlegelia sp.]HVI27249.1 hypothetical protein [Hansschlegelia sp.]
MKRWQAGLAAALAIGSASSAFAADLPYGRGYHERRVRTVVSEDYTRIRPVDFRLDVRTTPWLRYEVRPQLVCRLAWERGRRGDRPVEVCQRW